jgi:hypothetical protein
MVNTPSGTAAGLQLFQDANESWVMSNPASSTALAFSNSGTERMRLDASGNLGVGTASPSAKLEVAGSGNAAQMWLRSTDTTSARIRAYVNAVESGVIGFDNSRNMFFETAGTERMRLDASGRLGIGTTTPSRTLTVNGSTNITGSLDVTGAFTAQTKSFKIQHQVQTDKSLVYGVLEGPEHAVYARGRVSIGLTGTQTIYLPDEWEWLVDEDTITVQLTPIGSHQKLYVESTNSKYITIAIDGFFTKNINCYYLAHATRKDVAPLQTVQ